MTWHAQAGKIVLQGEEAKLFRNICLELCDRIVEAGSDEDSTYGGATVFDYMSRTQQLASLEAVSRHLFFETEECLELVAWSEATLATLLSAIRSEMEVEIELADSSQVREVLLQSGDSEFDSKQHWDNLEEWNFVFDCYEERFLWDDDFEYLDLLDLPPQQASAVKEALGILDDYHTAPGPDLNDDTQISEFPRRLRMLLDSQEKEEA